MLCFACDCTHYCWTVQINSTSISTCPLAAAAAARVTEMLASTSGRACTDRCWEVTPRSHRRHTVRSHVARPVVTPFQWSSSDSSSTPQPRKMVVMCSSQQEAAQPQQSKAELEKAMKEAIAAEDYATAAKLKEQIWDIDMQDPLTSLKSALEGAIAEERYDDAARLRDQIRELEEANKPQPPEIEGLTTGSDTVTDGIRVKVRSYYVPAQSRPELGQYFFAYSVSISNEGQKVVMLERRHWVIIDGNGKLDHVRGPGVVGEQPILQPGKSFEYQSACPLYTTFGTMEGEYDMVTLNDQGEWVDRLEVKIGRFALIKPDMA